MKDSKIQEKINNLKEKHWKEIKPLIEERDKKEIKKRIKRNQKYVGKCFKCEQKLYNEEYFSFVSGLEEDGWMNVIEMRIINQTFERKTFL